jgi:VanZ family protein
MTSLENTKCKSTAPRTDCRWFLTALFYFGFISVLSSIPGKTISDLGFVLWDKAVHFAVYGPLGFFLGLAFSTRPGVHRKWAALASAVIATTLLGALDETHQLFVEGRFSSVDDAIADTLGGLVGAVIAISPYPLAVWNHLRNSSPIKRKNAS